MPASGPGSFILINLSANVHPGKQKMVIQVLCPCHMHGKQIVFPILAEICPIASIDETFLYAFPITWIFKINTVWSLVTDLYLDCFLITSPLNTLTSHLITFINVIPDKGKQHFILSIPNIHTKKKNCQHAFWAISNFNYCQHSKKSVTWYEFFLIAFGGLPRIVTTILMNSHTIALYAMIFPFVIVCLIIFSYKINLYAVDWKDTA